MRYIKSFPDVRFVTAREAATKVWADRAPEHEFTEDEIREIARAVGDDITFQRHGDYALTAGEIFALLNKTVLGNHLTGRFGTPKRLPGSPLGPTDAVASLAAPVTTDASQLIRTAVDVDAYLSRHHRLPPTVWLGSVGVLVIDRVVLIREIRDDYVQPAVTVVVPDRDPHASLFISVLVDSQSQHQALLGERAIVVVVIYIVRRGVVSHQDVRPPIVI